MKQSFKALNKKQKGIAMVEFAISMPVIIFLLYCLGEIGRIQMMSNTLAKSVRDGARYLAENSTRGTTGIIDISDDVSLQTSNLVVYGMPVAAGDPVGKGYVGGGVGARSREMRCSTTSRARRWPPSIPTTYLPLTTRVGVAPIWKSR